MAAAINSFVPRIAVLVDADNVQSEQIRFATGEMTTLGTILLRRAFGRLTSIRAHEEILVELGFSAEVALPPAGSGKNAADLLLAQYATRLAERRAVDAVAIVSSDGDFAAVASGLAEAGVRAIGFGRPEAPQRLREACSIFVPATPASAPAPGKPPCGTPNSDFPKLRKVIDQVLGKNGRASATAVGQQITPAFGGNYKKHFAVSTLSELIARLDCYRMEGAGPAKQVVRVGEG